ncbi:MAG: glycosyltransferase [Verrucomicrobiaceae bacterium]|nr:glycosyltransferase [Verrucomicrobiaceae bacterium]
MLKAPGPDGERGVIVTHFEYNWRRMVKGIDDFATFTGDYDVIYTTSWSPPNYGALAMLLAVTPEEIMVQPNHRSDMSLVKAFHPRVSATRCIVSEWLLPECSQPKEWNERDIDLLYVANWAPFKRHREFFAVLKKLPKELRVICVGQPDGGHTLQKVQAIKASMGVPQDIEFRERLPIDEVALLQARAKVAVLFSRREGANIAAAEALMAGALLAMREDAHVGARAYVNAQTGALFSVHNAAEVLKGLLERGGQMNPRGWAEVHLDSRMTIKGLNEQLRDWSAQRGLPWLTDLAVPFWRPYQKFACDEDRQRLLTEYGRLHERYPSVFLGDLIDTGHQ